MNLAHWHLLLTHLPIIGTIIGTMILITGFIYHNNSMVKRTGLGVLVFAALCAIPSFLTGEGAEEVVENIPGVSESFIEAHEDMAKGYLIIICILGAFSILTFIADVMKSKSVALLYVIVLIGALATSVDSKLIATSGGEIRHSEIRKDAATQPVDTNTENNKSENSEKEDDD